MNGRLLDAVQAASLAAGTDSDADDVADAVWLASAVAKLSTPPETAAEQDASSDSPAVVPADTLLGAAPGPPPDGGRAQRDAGEASGRSAGETGTTPPGQVTSPGHAPTGPEPEADWRLPPHDRLFEPASWVPLRSPAADLLPDTLAMGRALRPLRRRMPSRTEVVLDVEATVDQAAEKDLWLPKHRPASDRWLDLALVIDTSRSMAIWRSQLDELRLLMERLGAFRDVRVWRMDGDLAEGEPVTLRSGSVDDTAPHDLRELVDPAGLRLVLVASDCVGEAWAHGAMDTALRLWGSAGPVAVLQMLPQRLWASCSPELRTARLTSPRPAAPNASLEVSFDRDDPFDGFSVPSDVSTGSLPVPVLELQSRWLSRWASLVAGSGRLDQLGTVMVVRDSEGQRTDRPDSGPMAFPSASGNHDDVETLLLRYQDFASTEALHLARCLAAAPLSLPVMRLVRQSMLPQSRPSVLAEVFLGGLLRQVSGPEGPERDPDTVEYDFAPGIRERLLAGLHQRDKLEVLAKVSEFLAARSGSPNDFRAFVSVGETMPQVLVEHPPFARVTFAVLVSMGGRYAEAARRLDRLIRRPQFQSQTHRRQDNSGSASISSSVFPGRVGDHDQYASRASDHSASGEAQGDGVGIVDAPGRPDVPAVLTEREAVAVSQSHTERRVSRPNVFGGVPHRNPHFTGRDALLDQLHGQLLEGSRELALLPHAVHGLGGVGKTHLAIEYAWRYLHEYQLVWWIPSESVTTVRTSLVALAEAMGVATPGQDTDKTISAVLDALRVGQPYSRWLLIYDNAQAPEEMDALLPVPAGHVLITSRNPEWSDRASLLEVDVFDRPESIALLQRRGSEIGDDEAGQLAEMLGDLPLALDQAAAWQAATATPAPELVTLLGERLLQLLVDRPTGYPASVVATWDLAFTELRRHSPGAARLLELLAFFGSDPIPIPVIRDGRNADIPAELKRVLGDDLQLRRAIREIGRYALAKVDPARNRLEIHRLVQSVLRDRLTPEQAALTRDSVHRILGAANPGLPDELHTHERHGELLPHITLSGVIDGTSRPGHQAALDQIRYRFNKGFYSSAASLGRHAVEVWRETLDPDDELTLIAQRHLAMAVRELGEYAEAAELNRSTLEGFRRVVGEDHEHTLATLNSFTRDLRLQGRFEEARTLDEVSLERHVRRFGEEDLETLKARNNLGVDLRMLGRGDEALELDQETYRQVVEFVGSDHQTTFGILANLGRDHTDSGRYDEAIALLIEASDKVAQSLGQWHRMTRRTQLNLVIVLRRSGRIAQAARLAEELLGRVRNQLAPGHETLLSAIVTFGNALLAVGDTVRAREHLAEALQGYRTSAFGPAHPFTHAAAVDLAVALRAAGDYRQARELDEQALESLRGALGPDHPFSLVAQLNLAHDLALVHEHARALELSGDAYTRSRRVRGEDRPETLVCGLNHAFDLRANGDDDASETLSARMGASLRDLYGEDHPAARAAAEGRRAESDLEHWDT